MKNQQKTLALWIVVILLMAMVIKVFDQKKSHRKTITYSEFIQSVENAHVQEVTFKGENEIYGKFKEGYENGVIFRLTGSTGPSTFDILRKNSITPNYEEEEKQSFFTALLVNWGPMIFLVIIFYFFMRQIQIGGGKAMSFGKSKAKLQSSSDRKITFADVAGVEEAKEELVEVVDFLKDPKKYTALGGKIPKGVLLVGPPGTGKTLLAKAVAGEAGVPFFSISGSDFVEMFVGVGASRVRDLFEQGKRNAPCIIFIDEIDAVGRHRGAGMGGGHDEREQTLNQLLVEMDGFETNEGVILISATNRMDVLDPALLRPGRFDRRVNVSRPDVRGRLQILTVHTRKTPVAKDIDLEVIAKGTPGFTGADLANLVNEAALLAARENKKEISSIDFENAKDKVLMGVARKSMVISEKEKRVTAYHEAGHTIVGMNLPHTDPIHKVSIIPRGMALGVTQTLPDEELLNLSRGKANNYIAFLLGGRIAEEMIFNEQTNGASNDIERSTDIARNMVCNWGMSASIGPINLAKSKERYYGGDSNDYSPVTAQKIDEEIKNIIEKNYQEARTILETKRTDLEKVAEALILWETLDLDQIKALIAGKDIGAPLKTKPAVADSNQAKSTNNVSQEETTISKPIIA
ncbi:MAG: ATP-dependent zinc metalloprotease FtsH [Bacteriovoracaceae bacterium]